MLNLRSFTTLVDGFGSFLRNRRGEVALEYGLIVAMIAIALLGMTSMTGVADSQSDSFRRLAELMAQ